mgnify:FL=1
MDKNMLKRLIFVIIFVVIVVAVILIIQNTNKTEKALKELGYSEEDITVIVEKLSETDIEKILNMEYNQKLASIINAKYYIPDNLDRYLAYSPKTDNIDDIISIVNVGADSEWYTNTEETNLDDGIKMLVNKFHYLKEDYSPDDIVPISNWYAYEGHSTKKEVYDHYISMWNDANELGLVLLVNSSYRTFEEQQEQYDMSNDDYASRPGFSEHQTGLALDIVADGVQGNEFENTDEFKWLQENAYKYGFILRYPKGKEHITGYNYESWHYRYVGKELAAKVKESGLTYDEYYAYYCEYKKAC